MMMKDSTKKWQVTAGSGVSCSLQTRRLGLYFGQLGYESVSCILVVLWPEVGTLSAAFFADMYELSCPFSKKEPVEADLSFCTSPPNLIACNVLMCLTNALLVILLLVFKYLDFFCCFVLSGGWAGGGAHAFVLT
jgi:hypothetical protein